MPKVFISFDYDDITSKKVVDNWKNQEIGQDISFSSEDGHSYSAQGDDYVQGILREQINKAQVVLVIVGDRTSQSKWVRYEVHHAKSQQKKVIWTKIPGTNGSPPQEITSVAETKFDMQAIRQAIRG